MNLAYSAELICFLILSSIIVAGSLAVVLLENIVYSAFLLGGVFMAVAGLYLLLNASFVAAAQILVYVGAVNVLILFAIMLVNKKEKLKPIEGLKTRKILSGAICSGLLVLLLRVSIITKWNIPGPASIGEKATERIGEHLFTDYLLPFELASILLLMAMIGAIVLARRDISNEPSKINDFNNGKSLTEKEIPLLSENTLK